MFITNVEIENYRSVRKTQTLNLPKIADRNCFILLGINESGKSNILRAIGLLSRGEPTSYHADCQNEAEANGEDIQLWFKLETRDPGYFQKILVAGGMSPDLAAGVTFDEVFRGITISSAERSDYHVIGLSKISPKIIDKFVLVDDEIQPKTPTTEIKDDQGRITNSLTVDRLQDIVVAKLDEEFFRNTPAVVAWRSTPKYRITDQINLNSFASNPSASIPLRNCFRIAGIDTDKKIADRIAAALGSAAKTAMMAQLLGEKVTSHINAVWPEHKVGVKFHVNGSSLSFLVEDKDNDIPKYEVEQRSDGFKHFISILLNLSAESRTKTLKNRIILLDEPETHLHPSGQRYLRDELLEIAKENTVIFATHSIFMVDTKHLDRHVSVQKANGATQLFHIEKDNPYREEVLFEALGTSILQLMEPNVIVFEGKTDRDIFDLYARKFAKDLAVPAVTSISADSADSILKYTKFFNRKLVKGFVVVDSDTDGKRAKVKVLNEAGYNKKNTFEINDILDTGKESTLEDLFSGDIFIKIAKDQFELAVNFDAAKLIMTQLKSALQDSEKPFREPEKEVFKRAFFDRVSKLSKKELAEQLYYKFFESLCAAVA